MAHMADSTLYQLNSPAHFGSSEYKIATTSDKGLADYVGKVIKVSAESLGH